MPQGPQSCSVVAFRIAPDKPKYGYSGPHWDVEAVVLPRITTDLPTSPISFNKRWKHLSGLRLADPEFGIPGHIDVLLGIDVFSHVILHGQRNGPPGFPSAFETHFGWVLSGTACSKRSPQQQVVSCFASTATDMGVLLSLIHI